MPVAYQRAKVFAHSTQVGGVPDTSTTLGWQPTCGCGAIPGEPEVEVPFVPGGDTGYWAPAPIPCTVLDCFVGSGTTGRVALRLGRDFIGIDLNPDYCAVSEAWLRRVAGSDTEPVPLAEDAAQARLI